MLALQGKFMLTNLLLEQPIYVLAKRITIAKPLAATMAVTTKTPKSRFNSTLVSFSLVSPSTVIRCLLTVRYRW